MLERNDKTGKLDYKVPVDTACMGTTQGCPAAHLKNPLKVSERIDSLIRLGQRSTLLNYNDAMMQMFPEEVPADPKMFDQIYDLKLSDVVPITTEQAMHLRPTDVVLVRSKSLPEIGDHFMLVTGHAVKKDHGIRPQTAVFPATQNSILLDVFDQQCRPVVLLKLNNEATQAFLDYYKIHLDEGCHVVSDTYQLEMK